MIKTKRISLDPIKEEDYIIIQSLWQDEEVIKYTNVRSKLTSEKCKERVLQFSKINQQLSAPVIFSMKCNEQICGIIGCPSIDREKEEFGLFYQIMKSYWGVGIGNESANSIVGYMKDMYPKSKIYADVVNQNIASIKILERTGFEFIGADEEKFKRDGKQYEILKYIKNLS